MKLIYLLGLSLIFIAAVSAQGDRCTPKGNLVNTANYDHCMEFGGNMVGWYNYNQGGNNLLEMCLEAEVGGWFGFGWGGTGKDFVLFWLNGQTLAGGDHEGHKNTVVDPTDNTVLGQGSDQNGVRTACFTRELTSNDAADFQITPDEFIRCPYATSNTNPAATFADSDEHGQDGSVNWMMSDPTAVPAGGGNNGDEDDILGSTFSGGALTYVAIGCGALLILGVGYQLKKNNDQVAWQKESMSSGGYSQGGYGGHGGYSSGGYSQGKYSQASSRSRGSGGGRSRGSKGSRGRSHGSKSRSSSKGRRH